MYRSSGSSTAVCGLVFSAGGAAVLEAQFSAGRIGCSSHEADAAAGRIGCSSHEDAAGRMGRSSGLEPAAV